MKKVHGRGHWFNPSIAHQSSQVRARLPNQVAGLKIV
jgi:hypothetical protein